MLILTFNEFFKREGLQTKRTITQKQFLENMGIIERAKIISKKMKFTDQSNLYLRMKRLLEPKIHGKFI